MDQPYLWIKALHIIAVIAFMAGMFYLPRLFVYHAAAAIGSVQSETFKVMERKLNVIIMRPALVLVYATGIALAIKADFFKAAWLNCGAGRPCRRTGWNGRRFRRRRSSPGTSDGRNAVRPRAS